MPLTKIIRLTDSQLEQYNFVKLVVIEEDLSMEDLEVFVDETEKRVDDLLSPLEKEKKILQDRLLVYKIIIREMLGPS